MRWLASCTAPNPAPIICGFLANFQHRLEKKKLQTTGGGIHNAGLIGLCRRRRRRRRSRPNNDV
jgi:hypothetical protein